MTPVVQEKLDGLVKRHAVLCEELTNGHNEKAVVELGKLGPMVETVEQLRAALSEYQDLTSLIEDSGEDVEMKAMAREEILEVEAKLGDLEHACMIHLLPRDIAEDCNAILEVRAGTGGEEAALFAADMFQMYQKFAQLQGWRFEVLEEKEAEAGGFKEASASIKGSGVFGKMRWEVLQIGLG